MKWNEVFFYFIKEVKFIQWWNLHIFKFPEIFFLNSFIKVIIWKYEEKAIIIKCMKRTSSKIFIWCFPCFLLSHPKRLQMCIVLHLLMMACVNVEIQRKRKSKCGRMKRITKHTKEKEIVMRVAWCRSHALPYTIS